MFSHSLVTKILLWATLIECLLCENFDFTSSDPDARLDVVQLIESRGFIAETHYVTTDDEYILTIHRIVNPFLMQKKRKPVMLQHGLLSSGIDWIINAPALGIEQSEVVFQNKTVSNNLGFALSLFGYDVWLTNSRGNTYGVNHTKLDPMKDKNFWEFTYDEMIQFDLPATIKYILKVTNHATMGYIGHSQGNQIMFGLLASQTEYSKIIRPFVALAPITRVSSVKTPFRVFGEDKSIRNFLYEVGGPFLPPNNLVNKLGGVLCSDFLFREVCANILFLIIGPDHFQLNKTRLHVYVAHTPAGISAWNLVHHLQSFESKKFQKFDYGADKNRQKYGTKTPPLYNLTKIDSRCTAIIFSQNDWISDPDDVQFLRDQVKGQFLLDYKVPFLQWNHADFIWGIEAAKYVNTKVLWILEKFRC